MKTMMVIFSAATMLAPAQENPVEPWNVPRMARLELEWEKLAGSPVKQYNVYWRGERTTNMWTLAGSVIEAGGKWQLHHRKSTNAPQVEWRAVERSNRTAGPDSRSMTPSNVLETVRFTATLDMSLPIETCVTAVSTDGVESFPTQPVRHSPAMPPRPAQHRAADAQLISTNTPAALRRGRAAPVKSEAPPIPDAGKADATYQP